MISGKRIALCFVVAAVVYAALLVAWLGVGGVYGAAFRTVGNVVFGSAGGNAVVVIERVAAEGAMDSQLMLRKKSTGQVGHVAMSSRFLGYMPMAILVALVSATPMTMGRRLRALAWGSALVQVYVLLRVWLVMLAALSGGSAMATFSLGGFGDAVIVWLAELLGQSMSGCYLGPIVLWMLVAVRVEDWRIK